MSGPFKYIVAGLGTTWVQLPSTDKEPEAEAFLGPGQVERQTIQNIAIDNRPWIVSTAIFASLTVISFVLHLISTFAPACEPWRRTDLEPARELIREYEVRFNGALTYNESGKLVIESSGDQRWIGNPTPEMDALWDQVEAGSIVLLEGPEADMVRDKTTLFDGYWVTGLDVVHQMHCLNKIRKSLYPEYYQDQADQSATTEMLHVEHCFDYIRQAVMCNADVTPVTLTWYSGAQTFGPDFRTTHTCRNFDTLLQWSLARTKDAVKKKGPGIEKASDPQFIIPGSLQGSNRFSHGGHAGH